MNSVLDSSLEALAFNYLNFGFLTVVNNLWTWVAVITAAVSFWRLRATGGCAKHDEPASIERTSNGSDSISDVVRPDTVDEQPRDAAAPTAGVEDEALTTSRSEVVGGAEYAGGVTKGKFVMYYEDDGQWESDQWTVMEEPESKEGERSESDGWWENWEKLLKMRMGKNGWYLYQDLTELNGNVVRFWDAGFGTFTKESSYCCC